MSELGSARKGDNDLLIQFHNTLLAIGTPE